MPTGTFVGAVRISDGALTGSIDLPPAQFTFRVAGIVPLVTATAQIVEAQPVTGTLDYWSHYPDLVMTATVTINLRIISAYAPGIPLNLVGSRCATATPMEVTMSGNANLSGPSTLTGVYTIPPFKTCGNLAVTTALNLTVSGPGNTFTATATP